MLLKQGFYDQKTLTVAKNLLGSYLLRGTDDGIRRYMIVETEAYNGPLDQASHAGRGQTPRNSVMFGDPGLIYVYFTYGMHHMLNIVTEKKGYPAAVLIRALEPLDRSAGLRTDGPARLAKALEIDLSFNKKPVFKKKTGLWIESGKPIDPGMIASAKRIGVDYAGEYKDKKWRFYLKDNSFVSKK